MELRSHEIEVLRELKERQDASPAEIAKNISYSKEGVLAASESLRKKNLIEVNEKVDKFYVINEEGEKLLKNGFPEFKIIEKVKNDFKEISELKKEVEKEEIEIGLGWLKRKGLGIIDKGKINLTKKGQEMDLEESNSFKLLKLLKKGRRSFEGIKERIECPEESIKELRDRNKAIGIEEEKSIILEITENGRNLEVEEEEKITELTSEDIRSGKWREKDLVSYDIALSSKETFPGKIHPYQRLLDEMRQIFQNMGFKEIKGNSVESSFWNFDALFQPQDHPAREMQDTFYIEVPESSELPSEEVVSKIKEMHERGNEIDSDGWGGTWDEEKSKKVVLRTHTTATTIRYLSNNPDPPQKVFSIDRAYRRETIDATHLPQFYQLEGIVLGENVSFKNLLGYLGTFYEKMGFEDIRFRPGYFPYTEPSVEPEVYVEELNEWVELGGAGVFRKEVTNPFGVKDRVLAWGLGIGRLAMLRLGLNDLRELFRSDIDWLRRFPSCQLSH